MAASEIFEKSKIRMFFLKLSHPWELNLVMGVYFAYKGAEEMG